MNRIKSGIYFVFIMAIAIGCGAKKKDTTTKQAQQKMGPADYVEQAVFTNFEGDSVRVSDFKGKVVMIDFWETWCKPCTSSFPGIQKLVEEYPDDFVALAVTPGFTNTQKDAENFASEHDYDFVYLMDATGLHKKLGVQGIPYKVFIDAEGNYIKSSLGSAGPKLDYKKIKHIIEKYKAGNSGQGSVSSD